MSNKDELKKDILEATEIDEDELDEVAGGFVRQVANLNGNFVTGQISQLSASRTQMFGVNGGIPSTPVEKLEKN